MSAGVWLGIDVVMAVLVGAALLIDDDATWALAYQELEMFVLWSLLAAGLVCLASGIVLGLDTKYGVLRYWLVTIKLVLNLLLTALVLVALHGEVLDKAELGRRFETGESVSLALGDLIYPPSISPTALLIAFALAVFKPWGRLRKRPATQQDTR